MVLDAAEKSGGRFFPFYRPEAVSHAAARGTLGVDYGDEVSTVTRQIADELLSPAMSATLGVGEIVPVTTDIHPAKIVRDMAPIVEALTARGGLPIMFPTGYTGWKGVNYFCYESVWVDELAGAFPEVPIVLAKMGRSIRASFDACKVVAMRNAKRLLRHDRHLGGAPARGDHRPGRAPDHVRQRLEQRFHGVLGTRQSQNRDRGSTVGRGA
jgi:hypothetical protein